MRTRRLFALALAALAQAAPFDKVPRIVVVFPTHPGRYPLVQAGRSTWRGTTPTVILTEGPVEGPIDNPLGAFASEHWFSYPDLSPEQQRLEHAWKKGDQKLAASFRIANQTFGEAYDWLAVGDDDTVFFMPATSALVEGLDPNVPYILADVVSFCSPGERCKKDKVCSLPRNMPHQAEPPANASCVRSPAVEPCTPAALAAPGTCDLPSPWYGLPFPCGRNGALLSRGMMRVLSAEQWREKCELPNTLGGGGELRVYKCLYDAGFAMTDPTPGDDLTSCTMGYRDPREIIAAADAAAASGECDAACDRILRRTVSLSLDSVGATPQAAQELHTAVQAALAALQRSERPRLEAGLAADSARLGRAMERSGFGKAPFVFTLTTSNRHRWRLFLNWLEHAAPLRLPLLVFAADNSTLALCHAALASANERHPAPRLCFHAQAVLGRYDSTPGNDGWQDMFWRRVVAVAKPLSLALATGTGVDCVFVETDVVIRGDVLATLRARPATATITCATGDHDRKSLDLPEGNAGLLFFRGEPRVAPLLRDVFLRCAPAWETVDDQGLLINTLTAARASLVPTPFLFDCVDSADGFTTSCGHFDPQATQALHVACIRETDKKIEWMRANGLWHAHRERAEHAPH